MATMDKSVFMWTPKREKDITKIF